VDTISKEYSRAELSLAYEIKLIRGITFENDEMAFWKFHVMVISFS
jgi:hypothetical protein